MNKFFHSLAQTFSPKGEPHRREERTVIFLHIPKTAGTAVRDVIAGNYRKREIYNFPDIDAREAMEQFRRLPEKERCRYRAVLGHMWYGLHEAVPRPATYVTLLRDPVERIVSHYHFVRNTKGHYLHRTVIDGKMGLAEYVSSGLSTELDNGQTRLLAGAMDEERYPFGGCTEDLLATAEDNLKKSFAVVGLQERYEETLSVFEKVLGWETSHRKKNVTPRRPSVAEIPRRDRQAIEDHNALDRRLYRIGSGIFRSLLESGHCTGGQP